MTDTQLLEERATGIGGSDIASVLNVGYGCALRLYREKRGEEPDFPRQENAAMELGKVLEPWIAEKFGEQHGCSVTKVGVRRSAKYPFLLVHADRLYRNRLSGKEGVLEIKAVGSRVFSQMKRDGLPQDYYLQLQWGMGLWDTTIGAFAVCNRDTGDVDSWEHQRDDELIVGARDRAIQLWSDIQAGNPPARLDPDDRRCARCGYRRSCQGKALIQILDKKIEADESMRPLLADYGILRAELEVASDAFEAKKEEIRAAMGDRQAVTAGESKVYYRPQTRASWAAEEMAAEWCRLAGKVDYDGEFIPMAPVAAQERFKRDGAPFKVLRIY